MKNLIFSLMSANNDKYSIIQFTTLIMCTLSMENKIICTRCNFKNLLQLLILAMILYLQFVPRPKAHIYFAYNSGNRYKGLG